MMHFAAEGLWLCVVCYQDIHEEGKKEKVMLKRIFSVLILTFCVVSFSAISATAGSSVDGKTKTMEGVIAKIDNSKEKTNLVLKKESGNKVKFSVSEDIEMDELASGDKVSVKYTSEERVIKSISELPR